MARKRSESPLFEPENHLDAVDELTPEPRAAMGTPTATMYHGLPLDIKTSPEPTPKTSQPAEQTLTPARKRKALDSSFDVTAYFASLDSKIDSGEVWEEVLPYDASSEPLPLAKVSVLCAGFGKAEALITQEVLQALLKPSYGPPVIIGVRGPAGAGKTSLVNGLLSTDGLTHTSSGSVGTYVPVEYLPLNQQPAPYGFEIGIFSFEESQKIIKTRWQEYYKERLADDNDELDDNDTVDLAKPAKDAFLALFSDLPDCTPKLLEWGRERYEKLSLVPKKQPLFAHTVSDLRELMEPFVQTAVAPQYGDCEDIGLESSVWPFAKIGRVVLEATLLSTQSLILVDLPGTSDCNKHRVRLTENYIKECRITLVVFEIKRGGDKEETKQGILEAWRRRQGDSVTLVLTHTDNIDDEANCKDPLEPEEESVLADLKAHRSTIDQKLKKIHADLKSPKNRKNTSLRADLQDQKERCEIHIRHVDMIRKQILVEARSRQVNIPLRNWFRERTGVKEPLQIFCVSTKDYLEVIRQDDSRSIAQPCPTAESTQIVQLRRHLFTMINKRGQEETMVNYCRRVKHLLNEMSLACTGHKPMYEREHLLKFIKDAHDAFPEQCRRGRQDLEKRLQPITNCFNDPLYLQKWIRKAEAKCEQWGNFNAITVGTFLKREGVHKKPDGKKMNWNRTLLDYAAEDLEPLLNALCGKACDVFEMDLKQGFRDILDEVEHTLKFNLGPSQIKTFSEFFENIQLQAKDIEAQVHAVQRRLKQGFVDLTNDVLSLQTRNSPFRRAMKTTYAAVIAAHPPKSGKAGIHNSRRAAFKLAVTSQTTGPYIAIKSYINAGEDSAAGNGRGAPGLIMTFGKWWAVMV